MTEGSATPEGRSPGTGAVPFVVAGILVAVAPLTPWFRGGAGTLADTRLAQLRWTTLTVVAVAVTMAGAGWGWTRTGRLGLRLAVIGASIGLAVSVATYLLLSELAAMWLAPSWLPGSLRRLALGAGPRPGPWFAMAGCLVGSVAATVGLGPVASHGRDLVIRASRGDRAVVGSAAVVAGVVMLTSSRYLQWVGMQWPKGDQHLPGWSLPWVGGLTALISIAIGAVLVAALIGKGLRAPLALVALGWLATLPAALVLVVTLGVGRLTVPDAVLERIEGARQEVLDRTEWDRYVPADVGVGSDISVDLVGGLGGVTGVAGGLVVATGGAILAVQGARTGAAT